MTRSWRIQSDDLGTLDELVALGGAIHLERTNTREWLLIVTGETTRHMLTLTESRDGAITVTVVEGPGK